MIRLLALLAIAGTLWAVPSSTSAQNYEELELRDFQTLYKTVESEREAELRGMAELEAVRSCVGRLYYGEKLLLAEDLLDRYLTNYHKKYISESRRLSHTELKDSVRQEWRVVVRFGDLRDDMELKRFIYEPRYRPFFAVFFQLQENGRPAVDNRAFPDASGRRPLDDRPRQIITQIFDQKGLRVRKETDAGQPIVYKIPERVVQQVDPRVPVSVPTLPMQVNYLDLNTTQQLLTRVELQRFGVEVLVTGKINLTYRDTQRIYNTQPFHYYDADIELAVIRVNDGKPLYTIERTEKYTDKTKQSAFNLAMSELTSEVATDAANRFNPAWQLTYLDKADYQIMLTDVSESDVQVVRSRIETLAAQIVEDSGDPTVTQPEVYLRGMFADVAVLSVVYKGPRENLLTQLTSLQYPRLVVIGQGENQMVFTQVR